MSNNINTSQLNQARISTKRTYLYMPRFHHHANIFHKMCQSNPTSQKYQIRVIHTNLIRLGFDQTNTPIPRKTFLRQSKGLAPTFHHTLMSQGFNVETQQNQHYQNFKGSGFQTLSFNPNNQNPKHDILKNFKQHFTISLSSLGFHKFTLAYPQVRVFQRTYLGFYKIT